MLFEQRTTKIWQSISASKYGDVASQNSVFKKGRHGEFKVANPLFNRWQAALGNVGSKLDESKKMARLTILNQTDNW